MNEPLPPCHATTAETMVMPGIPVWLVLVAVAMVIVLSFVAVERWGRPKPGPGFRFNLIRSRFAYRIAKSRWFQAVPQTLTVVVLVALIVAGLFGNRIGNITPVAVWTIWWAGLIVAIAVLGPVFCFACPWDGLTNLLTRLRLKARVVPMSLGLSVPAALRNMYPAIALFTLLTWAELGLEVTTDPRATALMGLGMAALAVGCAIAFGGKAFCSYLCPIGRITGLYSNLSPVELRARNPKACRTCTTEDCLNGNERGYPCPTGISLKVVDNATMCTGCTECIKSCKRHNVAINVRPFAADLRVARRPRVDEAWLCLALLSLTLFHGLSMTTTWENFFPGEWSIIKALTVDVGLPRVAAFTLAMAVAISVPVGLYGLSCRAAAWLARTYERVSPRRIFHAYALSLLPIAFFYHLAHNAMHLLMEGGAIVPLASDPLGTGADVFGTATTRIGHLASDGAIWGIQLALIVVGHVLGVVVAHRASRRLFSNPAAARRSLIPMLVVMVAISIGGLALTGLDMNMRIGRM